MRIAILADIHGNSLALEAVLKDIQARGGVDSYWVLGDLCAIGYDPVGVVEQVSQLPDVRVVKGNADRYATHLELPPPSLADAQQDPSKIVILMEVAANFSWTRGALDATGWTDWLKNLPHDHTLTLPDDTDVLLIHSQPDTDEGKGLNPSLTDVEVGSMLHQVDAGLICVGHFHMPMHRYWDNRQIVNPGSVSNSFYDHTRANYAILEASATDFKVCFYAVSYDQQAVRDRMYQTLNIGNDYNWKILTGDVSPSWLPHWDNVSHLPPIEAELS